MKLEDKITVTINGEDREFLMSYNLLRRLAAFFNTVEELTMIATNDAACENILRTILAGKDRKYDHNQVDLDDELGDETPEEIDRLLGWGVAHVTDFFLKRAEKLYETFEDNKLRMERMTAGI